MAKDTTADATYTPQFFMPDVYSMQNYYAFGQSMPNWSSTAAVNDPKKYRFGYNGKEDDDEWGKQDYGFRIYDGRIGRFLSVDPLMKSYPMLTPYQFASNMPIWGADLDGLEVIDYNRLFLGAKMGLIGKILDANAIWTKYMSETWASATVGSTFGATKDGKYAKIGIPLILQSENDGESDINAVTQMVVYNAKTQTATALDEFQPDKLGKDEKIAVRVTINVGYLPSITSDLLTLPHEVILHADGQAALAAQYLNKEIGLKELKEKWVTVMAEGGKAGHKQIADRSNTSYESVNDATQSVINKYLPYEIKKFGISVSACGINTSGCASDGKTNGTPVGSRDSYQNLCKEIIISYRTQFWIERNMEQNKYQKEIGGYDTLRCGDESPVTEKSTEIKKKE